MSGTRGPSSHTGCWICSHGKPLLITAEATCFACHVASCAAHGNRDPGRGTFVCCLCVGHGLASSGRIDPDPGPVDFSDLADYRSRYEGLATASLREFERLREALPQILARVRSDPAAARRLTVPQSIEADLASAALALARWYLPEQFNARRAFEIMDPTGAGLLRRSVAILLAYADSF